MLGLFSMFPIWLGVPLVLLTLMFGLIIYYVSAKFSYWKRKGVNYVTPYPFVGSFGSVMFQREHFLQFCMRLYKQINDDQPFIGLFQGRTPTLFVRDPALIKLILVKDFAHFTGHGLKINEEVDPLEANNLFHMNGQKWKNLRAKLTPTFTSGRLKAMLPLMLECGEQLENQLKNISTSNESFEAKELLSRYTTDIIGSCAFGIKCDALNDPNCNFLIMGKKIFEMDFWRGLKIFVIFFLPEIAVRLRLALLSPELTQFFRTLVRDVIALRAKTGETRNDFMQLLIELKEQGCLSEADPDDEQLIHMMPVTQNEKPVTENDKPVTENEKPVTENEKPVTENEKPVTENEKPVTENEKPVTENEVQEINKKLTDDEVTAQAMAFFTAGFETSSTMMSFALLELAVNPDLQARAQSEIDVVLKRHENILSYQALKEMTYLDWIMQESLRKYPPAVMVTRECNEKYLIPDTEITLDPGTQVMFPIHALQNDPKYFPDPECFNPERFSNDETKQKNKFVFMPFGEGPRQCIGNRFALLQSKLGLFSVLRKYDVKTCPQTKYPIEINKSQLILGAKDGIWLNVQPRSEE